MSVLSPKQVERRYKTSMGDELGSVFYRLHCDRASLHLKWKEYARLFGTDESRVELLNGVAPAFFRMVQDALWENVLLHLCRLTEAQGPPGKTARLTLRCFPSMVAETIRPDVNRALRKVTKSTVFAWDWRSRVIGHSNRQIALQEKDVRRLRKASRLAVQRAIGTIDGVLRVVERHYCGVSPDPFDVIGGPGDANSLLLVLRAHAKGRIESSRLLSRQQEQTSGRDSK